MKETIRDLFEAEQISEMGRVGKYAIDPKVLVKLSQNQRKLVARALKGKKIK